MRNAFLSSAFTLLLAALPPAAVAADRTDVPSAIAAAVADPHRPADQIQLDPLRKPAQMLAFAGVKPGERVADFMPGNAYFTRLLSRVVGPAGKVYAFIPEEQVRNCPPREVAGSRVIAHDRRYANVILITGAVNRFSTPQRLDVLWTAQNYHDLHDTFMGPAGLKLLNKAFFKSLKPGGVFIVIDHAAAAGSGLRDTETLHRIDPMTLRQEIEAAGFVFDPLIRGKTDQFVFKFRRPAS